MSGPTLNAGCGTDPWGDVRVDFNLTGKPHARAIVESLPFRGDTFGAVRLQNVLEHTPNPGIMLREIHRVLRPGGELYLRTDNAACLWYHLRAPLRFVEGHRYHGDPGDHHYMIFKRHHLEDLARTHGFVDVDVRYFEDRTTTAGFSRLLRLLRPEMVAQHLVLRARKPAGT